MAVHDLIMFSSTSKVVQMAIMWQNFKSFKRAIGYSVEFSLGVISDALSDMN